MTKKNESGKQKPDTVAAVPLAIVGIGCLFPKAGDPETYWKNIREGIDAITEIPDSHWNPADYFNADKNVPDMTYARRGGFIDPVDFDPLLYGLSPNNIEATDTTQLLGMVVARQALLDAGYSTSSENGDGRPFDRTRTSVILGVTGTLELVIPLGARLGHPRWRKALADAGVADDVAEEVVQRIAESYVPWQENSFPGLLGNVAAGRIANRFDLGGTNCVVDAACASSLSAIHLAALELYSGRSDMAITGGFDTFNDIFMYMCFSKTPALSPTGNSRPFDINGDGTILGEGLGAIILKRLDDARRDNDKIYAVIKGMGSSSDGRGNAIYAPSANGQTRALKNAYRDAGVTPSSIGLVEAHGTGTRVGDAVEAEALSSVYREVKQEGTWCALGSVKSMIGHTKAAAGAAGLIKIAMALKHKVLPPTIKIDKPLELLNPGKAPVYVNTHKRPWMNGPEHPRRAAISAFGFGGSNFHCVLEEAEPVKTGIEWDGEVLIFGFSGKSVNALQDKVEAIHQGIAWNELRYQAARSLRSFNYKDPNRLVLVVTRDTRLEILPGEVRNRLADNNTRSWQLAEGAFFGRGNQSGKLAMMFPGQGSQYPDMLLDLACQFPQMQSALAQANDSFTETGSDKTLSDIIFPIPVFTEAERAENIERLRSTRNAQPAIGAVSVGTLNILEHFGITPDVTAGHSFGELTALCAAGRLDTQHLYRLAGKRGELMAAGKSADNGSMLAVSASAAVLHEILEAEQLDLIIANHNAPRQVVLSGATDQIDRAVGVLGKRGLGAKKLPVSAAFHSSFVSDAEKPFARFLDTIPLQPAKVPVFANATSEQYPQDGDAARVLLASQLARPVEFVTQIENMYGEGVRTFIETGPGNVLTGLVKSILGERDFTAVPVDASRGRKNGQFDLACALAQLAAAGHRVVLRNWDDTYVDRYEQRQAGKPGMTIKLTGANYVKPGPVDTQAADRIKPARETPAINTSNRSINPAIAQGSGNLLKTTQQAIIALQKMQEQTAQLHRQYLEGQEAAQRAIQKLIEQQQPLQPGDVFPAPSNHSMPGKTVSSPPADVAEITIPTGPVRDQAVKPPAEDRQTRKSPALESLLLEVVSEKTGYPMEMLSLEMSLDTDLGIDSIKRVEILSALHERIPGAGKIQPEDLGTFRLLKHIAEFLVDNTDTKTAPSSPAPSVPVPVPSGDRVPSKVLFDVVSEKTGYPVDMLTLEMNLDTDLGIDSIKRVEILSAFQEKMPAMPAINPDELARLQTLKQIADFMHANIDTPAVAIAGEPAVTRLDDSGLTGTLLAVVAEKTGYPVDMLRLEMNLDTDLGIDSIKRVEILSAFQERVPGAPVINPDHLASLQTLQQIVDYMDQTVPTPTNEPEVIPESNRSDSTPSIWRGVIAPELITWARTSLAFPEQGFIGVTDDGTPLSRAICNALVEKGLSVCSLSVSDRQQQPALTGLVFVVPEQLHETYITDALELIQLHADSLQQTGLDKTGLLACVTGLGGSFALDNLSGADPRCAAIAGMVKTVVKEWADITCRCIDVDFHDDPSGSLAAVIADELLLAGPVETAIRDGHRYAISLNPSAVTGPVIDPGRLLHRNELVVISGGARGITAEVAVELARHFKVNLLLLGRTPVPEGEPAWLRNLADEQSIKRALIDNSDEKPDPRTVESAYRRTLANREVLQNLKRMEAEGVRVLYRPVDIRNRTEVSHAINEARRELGPVAGVIHGAGILLDRLILDKTREQFNDVYSTKVDGLQALLDATREDDLKMLVMFSSSTGRFGRKGQVDYAAANETLNKLAQREARRRPACRVLSMNWGPWDGGMVTPRLKKLFEREGVGVIPLKAGAGHLVEELAVSGNVEIVILGSEPMLDTNRDSTENVALPGRYSDMHVAFERTITIDDYPVLNAHVMNGKAVLPAALVMEWFAHGAMHNNPGLVLKGITDFRIFKGVILDPDSRAHVQILAGNLSEENGELSLPIELRQGTVIHAGAGIVLGNEHETGEEKQIRGVSGNYSQSVNEVYGNGRLFHGKALQGITAINGCSEKGISVTASPAPRPSHWIRHPVRTGWITDPMVMDAAFQAMILWSFEHLGAGSLPTHISQYRQFCRGFPKDKTEINIRIDSQGDHEIRARIEFLDNKDRLVACIDGYECVVDTSLNEAFQYNRLVGETQ